jgi:hypothetical protein
VLLRSDRAQSLGSEQGIEGDEVELRQVLNTIEKPISEEEYLKMKGEEKKKEPKGEEERTMINQGGLAVVFVCVCQRACAFLCHDDCVSGCVLGGVL